MTPRFRLYPVEQHWCSFADYGAILAVTRRFAPQTVLEFGPGSSTLALLEGGAGMIHTCEDDPYWVKHHHDAIEARFPQRVKIVPYTWTDPVDVPDIAGMRFDLGMIDGPRITPNRVPVLRYVLDRCAVTLIACETYKSHGIRADIDRIAAERSLSIEILEVGPLAGSFAILGAAC